jgi:predicted DNA-binding transcriptional regulator YafY
VALDRLLAEFVEFIQRRKTVVLEELAAEFGLRTQVSPRPALRVCECVEPLTLTGESEGAE